MPKTVLRIVNPVDGKTILTLIDGMVIDASRIPTGSSIMADVPGNVTVTFNHNNGFVVMVQKDPPYSISGDDGVKPKPYNGLTRGDHTLKIDVTGAVKESFTIRFKIVSTTPTPIPPISGTPLPSGGDFAKALTKGGTILLERGGTYQVSSVPRITVDGTTVSTYGDPNKPAPKVMQTTTGHNLLINDRKNIKIQGIHFDGSKAKPGSSSVGIFNSSDIKILDCKVTNQPGMGITVEGYGGKRSKNVEIKGNVISDNWPGRGSHVSGLFASSTDNLVLTNNVFSTNGWKPGVKPATIFNHNVYLHGTCGPATVVENVFDKGASHGLQQRCGGISRFNLFIDNAIHQSYGLVMGSFCFPGGVSGDITGSVYIGGRDITGAKRGYCLELSNIKKTKVSSILCAHDNQHQFSAVIVHNCQNLDNPSDLLPPDRWDLTLIDVLVWDWTKKPVNVGVGNPKLTRAGVTPPKQADLRKVLGADFIDRAKREPATAARKAIDACRQAVGLP